MRLVIETTISCFKDYISESEPTFLLLHLLIMFLAAFIAVSETLKQDVEGVL